ncbi:hypothetical protein [Azotobacter beijerinckii]|uniref:hypothetical protein n=1 Tax=Azotobacter beijerinckii TaxID=170623 RepID=UPI0011321C62|nr:hypothetical protein [Azotobacter beijerinckii]
MFKIELDTQDIHVLNAAIDELPYKIAAPLVRKINFQIESQINSAKKENYQTDYKSTEINIAPCAKVNRGA